VNRCIKVNGLGFKSANDEPKRDPKQVDVSYRADDDTVHVATYKLDFEQKRWHTLDFEVFMESDQFIFEFTNNLKEIQLGQIIFYGE
jgi:hypothetical protein